MKTAYLAALSLLVAFSAYAQSPQQERNITLPSFGADSLHIPLSEEYYVIEDSCATMTRRIKFDKATQKFHGDFVDLSTADPNFVISKGTYSRDGLKHGAFEMHYTNGNPRAKGAFAANSLHGDWQLYYENGSPKLFFTASGNDDILVTNAWDEKGKQTVKDGNGKHALASGFITWSGQFLNGKPNGTWIAYSNNDIFKKPINTERFKEGQFVKGTGITGPYSNGTRLKLLNTNDFPFEQAERMMLARNGCEQGPVGRKVISAQFRNGMDSYGEEMKRSLSAYFGTVDLKPYDTQLTLKGEVSEVGKLVNFNQDVSFDLQIANGIVKTLGRLPALAPATIDGKPTRQPFEITFRIHNGFYQFRYRFLPISTKPL